MAGIPNLPVVTQTYEKANNSRAYKPFIDAALIDKYVIEKPEVAFGDLLDMAGRMTPVWDTRITTDEHTRTVRSTGIQTIVGGGVDTAATITIPVADRAPDGVTIQYQVNDILINPLRVQGKVTAIPATGQYTVMPLQTGTDFVAGLTAGVSRIVLGGNMWQENTLQPNGYTYETVGYDFYLQIIKHSTASSGTFAANSVTWYDDGSGQMVWYTYITRQAEKDYLRKKIVAMLTQNPNVQNLAGDRAMEGLFYSADTFGRQVPVAGGVNNFGFPDLETMIQLQEATNTGVKKFQTYMNGTMSRRWDIAFKDMLTNGAISYGNMTGEVMYKLGFRGMEWGGYQFNKGMLEDFNNLQGLGLPYNNRIYFIPDGMVETSQGMRPTFEHVYLANRTGYSREEERWVTGAANGAYTERQDRIVVDFRTERGNILRRRENLGVISA